MKDREILRRTGMQMLGYESWAAGQFTSYLVPCVGCIIHQGAKSQGEFWQANLSIRCHDSPSSCSHPQHQLTSLTSPI